MRANQVMSMQWTDFHSHHWLAGRTIQDVYHATVEGKIQRCCVNFVGKCKDLSVRYRVPHLKQAEAATRDWQATAPRLEQAASIGLTT